MITITTDRAETAAHARAVAAWTGLKQTRLGMAGYLCVLGFLAAGPATSIDVAERFGLTRQPTRELIHRMSELGIVHTAGRMRTGAAGPHSPLWAYGAGPVDRSGGACRDSMPELMQLRQILRLLETPISAKSLMRESGSGEPLVRTLLRIGRRLGLLHICAWDVPCNPQGGGVPVPCFVIGEGREVPRPRRIGNAESGRRRRRAETARREQQVMLNALCGRSVPAMGAAA